MFRGVGRLRLAVVGVVLALTVAGCSGGDGERVPEWVRSPPEYLSCGGMVDPRLMVDLIRAADMPKPNGELSGREFEPEEPSFECHVLGPRIGMQTNQEQLSTLAGIFTPPEPLLVPLGTLSGFVTFSFGRLYTSCTRASGTTMLESSIHLRMPQRFNPEARLAMARVMVDMTNSARERFGCSEGSLPVPEELPAIPDPGPVRWVNHEDGGFCNANLLTRLPGSVPEDDQSVWIFETPEPSKLLSTCEIRVGNTVTEDYEAPGHKRVAVVTYRGVLARAYQNSPKHAMPRYDVTCHGEPVSYRAYVQDPDGGGYVQAGAELQESLASSAAYHDECPLPEK